MKRRIEVDVYECDFCTDRIHETHSMRTTVDGKEVFGVQAKDSVIKHYHPGCYLALQIGAIKTTGDMIAALMSFAPDTPLLVCRVEGYECEKYDDEGVQLVGKFTELKEEKFSGGIETSKEPDKSKKLCLVIQ